MIDTVFMVTQLDSDEGYSVGRRVFILKSNNNYSNIITKMIVDKNVKGMYTSSRKVLYT